MLKFLESEKSVTTFKGKNKVPVCAEIREIGEILKKFDFTHYHYLVEKVVPICAETRENGEILKIWTFTTGKSRNFKKLEFSMTTN